MSINVKANTSLDAQLKAMDGLNIRLDNITSVVKISDGDWIVTYKI